MSDSDSDDDNNYIIQGNNIYYYCDVNKKNTLRFNSDIRKLSNKNSKDINVYINSDGGELKCAFSSFDIIKSIDNTVNTYCDGTCCSSGTILLLAGDNIYMHKNSLLLLHQLSTGFYGKRIDLKDEVFNTDLLYNKMVNIYQARVKNEDIDIKKELSNEKYMSAHKCLQWKLIDKII